MSVSKEVKERIVQLMLLELSTEEIAAETNYSISTIRITFEELRDELGVNSKTGIARAYVQKELLKLNSHIQNILKLLGGCQTTTKKKGRPRLQKKSKKR